MRNLGREMKQFGMDTLQSFNLNNLFNSSQISSAMDFDAIRNQIRVFGNLTSEELTKVENSILDFSAKTIFDPQQTATAFLDLQKAGLNTKQALEVLPNVGNLAAAGIIELSEASTMAIQTANAFNLEMSETERIANALVGGANISTASVENLGNALGYTATDASGLGVSLEETVVALSLLNDKGVDGERAGTGLRQVFASLSKPSKEAQKALKKLSVNVFDATGNFVGLENLLSQFQVSLRGMSTEEITKSLGSLGDVNAIAAIKALISTSDSGALAFSEYSKALKDTVPASEIAEEMMKTFKGTMDSLRGSIETLIIKAFLPLMNEVLAPIITIIISTINKFTQLPKPILMLASSLVLLASIFTTLIGAGFIFLSSFIFPLGIALQGVGLILTGFITALVSPITFIVSLGSVILGLTAVFATMIATISGITLITAGIIIFIEEARKSEELKKSIENLGNAFYSVWDSVSNLISSLNSLFGNLEKSSESGKTANDAFQPLINTLDTVAKKLLEITDFMNGISGFADVLNFANTDDLSIEKQIEEKRISIEKYMSENPLVEVPLTYQVKKGDTLNEIAETLGMTPQELKALNPQAFETVTVDVQIKPTLTWEEAEQQVRNAGTVIGTPEGDAIMRQYGYLGPTKRQVTRLIEGAILNTNQTKMVGDETLTSMQEELAALEQKQKDYNQAAFTLGYQGINITSQQYEKEQQLLELRNKLYLLSKNPVGNSILKNLGINPEDESALVKLNFIFQNLTGNFDNLKRAIALLGQQVVGIFTGQNSLKDLGPTLSSIALSATNMFTAITGIKIDEQIVDALREGDLRNAINETFINVRQEMFKQINNLIPLIGDGISVLVENSTKFAFMNGTMFLLNLLGVTNSNIIIEKISSTLGEIIGNSFKALGFLITGKFNLWQAISYALGLNENQISEIKRVFDGIEKELSFIFADINKFFENIKTKDVFDALKVGAIALLPVISGLASVFMFLYGVLGALPGIFVALKGGFQILFGIIEAIKTGDFSTLKEGISNLFAGIIGAVSGFISNISQLGSKIARQLGFEKLADSLQNVSTVFRELAKGDAIRALSEEFQKAFDEAFSKKGLANVLIFGINIIEGLRNGIIRGFENFVSWWNRNIKDKIINPILVTLGIQSPSTVMMEIGANIVLGLINGIAGTLGSLIDIFLGIGNTIINAVKDFIYNPADIIYQGIVALGNLVNQGINAIGDLISIPDLSGKFYELINSFVSDPLGTIAGLGQKVAELITIGLDSVGEFIGIPDLSGKLDDLINSFLSDPLGTLSGLGIKLIQLINGAIDGIGNLISVPDLSGKLDQLINNFLSDPLGTMAGLGQKIAELINANLDAIGNLIRIPDLSGKLDELINSFLSDPLGTISGLGTKIVDLINGSLDGIGNLIGIPDLSFLLDNLISAIFTGADTSGEQKSVMFVEMLGNRLKDLVQSGFDKAKDFILTIKETISQTIKDAIADVLAFIDFTGINLPEINVEPFVTAFDSLKNAISNVIDYFKNFDLAPLDVANEVVGRLQGFASDVGGLISGGIGSLGNALGFGGKKDEETPQAQPDTSSQDATITAGSSALVQSVIAQSSQLTEEQILSLQMIGNSLMYYVVDGMRLSMSYVTTLITEILNNLSLQLSNVSLQANNTSISLLVAFNMANQGWQQFAQSVSSSSQQIVSEMERIVQAAINAAYAIRAISGGNVDALLGSSGSPEGRALGGPVKAGEIYEFNENRRGVPFEIFQTGNRNYLLAGQNGNILSPLQANRLSPATANAGTQINQNINVVVNGSNLSESELSRAIQEGIRREREANPIERQLRRGGI